MEQSVSYVHRHSDGYQFTKAPNGPSESAVVLESVLKGLLDFNFFVRLDNVTNFDVVKAVNV